MLRYAMKNGKTPIFVTEKPNLYADMMRDLGDIGMKDVRPLVTNAGITVPFDGGTLKTAGADAHNKMLASMSHSRSIGNTSE